MLRDVSYGERYVICCVSCATPMGAGPAAVTNASCGAIPDEGQQFQYHPGTGALRPKASMCVAGFAGTVNEYRDCCLSVCPSSSP